MEGKGEQCWWWWLERRKRTLGWTKGKGEKSVKKMRVKDGGKQEDEGKEGWLIGKWMEEVEKEGVCR